MSNIHNNVTSLCMMIIYIGNEASSLKSLFVKYIKENMKVTDGKKLLLLLFHNNYFIISFIL